MGVNVGRLYFFVFGITGVLAGLAGAIGAPFLGAFQGAQFEVLLLALLVAVVGDWGASRVPSSPPCSSESSTPSGRSLFPELAHSPCLPH